MKQVVIENPIINSPYLAPSRYFRFDDDGITNELVDGRRPSQYFMPIAQPKQKGKQTHIGETEFTQDRAHENKFVNQVRAKVDAWRAGG